MGQYEGPRIRVYVFGVEMFLPVEHVASAFYHQTESGRLPLILADFFSNGDGIKVTVERIPRNIPCPDDRCVHNGGTHPHPADRLRPWGPPSVDKKDLTG